eukprot:g3386.t1
MKYLLGESAEHDDGRNDMRSDAPSTFSKGGQPVVPRPLMVGGNYHSLVACRGKALVCGEAWIESLGMHLIRGIPRDVFASSAATFSSGSAVVTGVRSELRSLYRRRRNAFEAVKTLSVICPCSRTAELLDRYRTSVDDLGDALRRQAERSGQVYVWGEHGRNQLGLGLVVVSRASKDQIDTRAKADATGESKGWKLRPEDADSDDDADYDDGDDDEQIDDLGALPTVQNAKEEVANGLTDVVAMEGRIAFLAATAIRSSVLGGVGVGICAAAATASLLVATSARAIRKRLDRDAATGINGTLPWNPKEESEILKDAERAALKRLKRVLRTLEGQHMFLYMMSRRRTLRYRGTQIRSLTRKLLPMVEHASQRRIRNYRIEELRTPQVYSSSEYVEAGVIDAFGRLQVALARFYEKYATCRTHDLSVAGLHKMMRDIGVTLRDLDTVEGLEQMRAIHAILASSLNIDYRFSKETIKATRPVNHSAKERRHILAKQGSVDLLCFESFVLRGLTASFGRGATFLDDALDAKADRNFRKSHYSDERRRHVFAPSFAQRHEKNGPSFGTYDEYERQMLVKTYRDPRTALRDFKRRLLGTSWFLNIFAVTDRTHAIRSLVTDALLNARMKAARRYRKRRPLTAAQARDVASGQGYDAYDDRHDIDSDEMEEDASWVRMFDKRAARPYWYRRTTGRMKWFPAIRPVNIIKRAQRISRSSFAGHPVRSIAAGQSHVLALTSAGCLFSWGVGSSGQLGMGDLGERVVPTLVPTKHISAKSPLQKIAAGGRHSALISSDGSLFMWGSNAYGQLAMNDDENATYSSPTRVPIPAPLGNCKRQADIRRESHLSFFESEQARKRRLDAAFADAMRMGGHPAQQVASVALGDAHTLVCLRPCLLKKPRALHQSVVVTPIFSAGQEKHGQLGLYPLPEGPQYALRQITGTIQYRRLVDIQTGARHALALTDQGEVYSWGWNHVGQCGVPTRAAICFRPTRVAGLDDLFAVSIGAGQRHSLCAAYKDVVLEPKRRDRVLRSETGRGVRVHCPYALRSAQLDSRLIYSCVDCNLRHVCSCCARRFHRGHRMRFVLCDSDAYCMQTSKEAPGGGGTKEPRWAHLLPIDEGMSFEDRGKKKAACYE